MMSSTTSGRAFLPTRAGEPVFAPVAQFGRHVLVVDDEIAIATFVAEALRDEGYAVSVRHDGASALVDILRRPPALVVLDVAMPVMVGDDVLLFLRNNGYGDLPVIMMTAGLNPEKYRSIGASEVLAKPFDIDSLLAAVVRLADGPAHG